MEVKEMVKKYKIHSHGKDQIEIKEGKNLSSIQIREIKEKKLEILTYFEEKKLAKEQAEKAEYAHLEEQLPVKTLETTHDDKKAQELLAQAEKIQYYGGPEGDGLDLGVSIKKDRLKAEAQKHCKHELEVTYFRGHTQDARLELTRYIRCAKCGLRIIDRVSDPVSTETILSC